MIFNVSTAGKRKALCTFLGAVGEILTFKQDGLAVATVQEGTAIELKQGVYDVTGSKSGFTKRITVKNPGQYNVYPDGALYWYGREIVPFDFVSMNNNSAFGSLTKNTDSMTLAYTCGWTKTKAVAALTESKLDLSGYKTLRFRQYASTSGINGYAAVMNTRAITYDTAHAGGIFSVKERTNAASLTEYALDISTLDSGYVGAAIWEYNEKEVYLYISAIWLDDPKTYTETEGGTNTVALSDTLQYTTVSTSQGWAAPGAFGQSENYFGFKTGDCNTALIPIGSFAFSSHSTRLRLSFTGHRPSSDFNQFRWALCSSDANKALYQNVTTAVADSSQITSGTATLVNYPAGANSVFSFDFPTENIPADTDLYVYLWPYERSGVAHISSDISATIYYGVSN